MSVRPSGSGGELGVELELGLRAAHPERDPDAASLAGLAVREPEKYKKRDFGGRYFTRYRKTGLNTDSMIVN